MRRLALCSALCVATGCVTSPIYTPGLQHVAPLKSRGDMSASYAAKAKKGIELSATMLVTDRLFVGGEYGESPRQRTREEFVNTRSSFGLGWTTAGKDSHTQNSIGYGEGSTSESIFGGVYGVLTEGAPYMATGRYRRLYIQHAATQLVRGALELGSSVRLSGVKVIGYRRFAGTPTTDGGINRPYNRDTTFSGNLSGLFLEPSVFFGLNFRGIRVTPQLTMAFPFTSTAFSAMPVDAGVAISVSSEIFKALAR